MLVNMKRYALRNRGSGFLTKFNCIHLHKAKLQSNGLQSRLNPNCTLNDLAFEIMIIHIGVWWRYCDARDSAVFTGKSNVACVTIYTLCVLTSSYMTRHMSSVSRILPQKRILHHKLSSQINLVISFSISAINEVLKMVQ